MAIDDSLDPTRLALGRIERALARAELSLARLSQKPAACESNPDGGRNEELRTLVAGAIADIDALLAPKGDGARDG